jgi:hypothetical protein
MEGFCSAIEHPDSTLWQNKVIDVFSECPKAEHVAESRKPSDWTGDIISLMSNSDWNLKIWRICITIFRFLIRIQSKNQIIDVKNISSNPSDIPVTTIVVIKYIFLEASLKKNIQNHSHLIKSVAVQRKILLLL